MGMVNEILLLEVRYGLKSITRDVCDFLSCRGFPSRDKCMYLGTTDCHVVKLDLFKVKTIVLKYFKQIVECYEDYVDYLCNKHPEFCNIFKNQSVDLRDVLKHCQSKGKLVNIGDELAFNIAKEGIEILHKQVKYKMIASLAKYRHKWSFQIYDLYEVKKLLKSDEHDS